MKGIVYSICCNETKEIYVGSTIESLNRRISTHKSSHNECKSKQILLRGNYTIEILEELDIDNIEILLWKERHYIDTLDKCINRFRPIINNEDKTEYNHKYWENHKEIINERRKDLSIE